MLSLTISARVIHTPSLYRSIGGALCPIFAPFGRGGGGGGGGVVLGGRLF